MATPAPVRKKLTEEEAARRLTTAMNRHFETLDPKTRAAMEKKFLRGPNRGTRAK